MTETDKGPDTRSDLLALTEDALAALANRGLVKRAVKELGAGTGATVLVEDGGEISATYPDGTSARLPAGTPLTEAVCTCAATGLCRHRIGLVLAYQRRYGGEDLGPQASSADSGRATEKAPGVADLWSPGEISDEALVRALGTRPVQEARRALAAGYQATVYRPTAGRGPRVELPTCTVTFHVPGDPAYATTDAVAQKHGEAVALAVWAFRAADAQGLVRARDSAHVNVKALAGGLKPGDASSVDPDTSTAAVSAPSLSSPSSPDAAPPLSAAADLALTRAAELVDDLLLDGVSTAGPLPAANLRRSARDLAENSLQWPAAVAEELVEQLDWYLERNARYELGRFADLAAEFLGRRRAVAASTGNPALPSPAQILGTAESARTALRRIRLIGLGARILGGPRHRTAELYFAHPHDGTVLVLRREWKFEEDEQPPSSTQFRTRRIAGSPLHMLAAGNLVSEAATRSARRTVELGTSRVAKTTVTSLGDAWRQLPDNVHVRDYAALAAKLGERSLRYLRPRIEAEDVYVLSVAEVVWMEYDPAEQCLQVAVRDEFGATARVRAPFRAATPAALDALSAVFADVAKSADTARTLMISGRVTARSGALVIDPIAVWAGGSEPPVVPDLAEGDDTAKLPVSGGRKELRSEPDAAASAALRTAVDTLAEHAHRGLDRVGATGKDDVAHTAARLSRTGFTALGALFAAYGEALITDDRPARVRTWTDAFIAVVACRESTA